MACEVVKWLLSCSEADMTSVALNSRVHSSHIWSAVA